MNKINTRRASITDTAIIAGWNREMARETENKELPEKTITRGVQRLIENPAYGFYLLAEIDNTIAGTLMVTTEWSDWRDGLFWWIQSVYVAPEFRRRGVYSALYEQVKQLANEQPDVRGYRLYVEKDNTAAQRSYRQLGMHETDYLMFEEMRQAD